MSDIPQGPGWWIASDGRWYPPETHPNHGATPPAPVSVPPPARSPEVPAAAPSAPAPTDPAPPDRAPAPGSRLRWAVGVAVLVVVLIGAGALVVTREGSDGTDDAAAPSATTAAPETTTTLPAPVELQLEAVGVRGSDPFTDSMAVSEVAVTTDVSLTDGSAPDGETTADGTQPGLYGGTRTQTCDTVALVAYLAANPDKAAAWASVIGTTVEGIPDYVAGLTPVVLRVDTRVTNHGFGGGQPTAYQAVLQSGTAVLVDRSGVPRVKCNCGNPLAEPGPLPTSITDAERYGVLRTSGTSWEGFDPTGVVVVSGGAEPVTDFTVVDVTTGESYTASSGSVVTTTTTAPPTTRPPTTRPPSTRPPTTYDVDPENPCGIRPGPGSPRATC